MSKQDLFPVSCLLIPSLISLSILSSRFSHFPLVTTATFIIPTPVYMEMENTELPVSAQADITVWISVYFLNMSILGCTVLQEALLLDRSCSPDENYFSDLVPMTSHVCVSSTEFSNPFHTAS